MVLRICDLKRPIGIKKRSKRLGRGIGSGRGKTSGKGHKGALSRTGRGGLLPGFEGGQMTLIRRVPKRGFTNIFKKEWNIVNLGVLEKNPRISDGDTVDTKSLCQAGILSKTKFPLKVLSKGTLKKALTIKAVAFSVSAKKAIEAAGGKWEIVKE
ncbi:MAG: 50S ribosomal protein L15 [Candidatus Omnitrophica bacterium]|jgi:large subunit ribosomal protein L15|nr:50S ribosomal protein L15 [Candidatus Omnitrophota bacterium]MDD4012849.1 50S ribosomal protein L15 [Candidatus Omnitrophota bacterium]